SLAMTKNAAIQRAIDSITEDQWTPVRYPSAVETKSRAGRRSISLPPQLIELLREHQTQQDRERAAARQLWHEGGWLFADPTGHALNPRTDTQNWKDLLAAASV